MDIRSLSTEDIMQRIRRLELRLEEGGDTARGRSRVRKTLDALEKEMSRRRFPVSEEQPTHYSPGKAPPSGASVAGLIAGSLLALLLLSVAGAVVWVEVIEPSLQSSRSDPLVEEADPAPYRDGYSLVELAKAASRDDRATARKELADLRGTPTRSFLVRGLEVSKGHWNFYLVHYVQGGETVVFASQDGSLRRGDVVTCRAFQTLFGDTDGFSAFVEARPKVRFLRKFLASGKKYIDWEAFYGFPGGGF